MKKFFNLHYPLFLAILLTLGFLSSCGEDDENLSNLTGLTSFNLQGHPQTFTIDQDALIITNGTDSLPFGSDVSALVAEFEAVPFSTVTVGDTEQESGVTVNNFNNPVTYSVTAQDGVTIRAYEVAVNVAQLDPETVSWNRVTAEAEWGPYQVTNGISFNDKLWMFGYTHTSFGTPSTATYSSTDGITWTLVDARDEQYNYADDEQGYRVPGTRRPAIVSFNDKMFIIGGYMNGREDAEGSVPFNNPTNRIWSSADGVSWTSIIPENAFSARERAKAVVLNNKIYLIGGNNAGSFGALGTPRNDVWSSSDAVTWTEETAAAAFDPRTDPSVFIHDGKIWVIGGKDATGTYRNDIWTSTDGSTWIEMGVETPFPGRMGHTTTIIDGKMIVIGGESLDGEIVVQNNDMWVSEDDGANWRLVTQEDVYSLPANFIGRSNHSTFSDDDGNIWILGGTGPKNETGADIFPRDVWKGRGVQ